MRKSGRKQPETVQEILPFGNKPMFSRMGKKLLNTVYRLATITWTRSRGNLVSLSDSVVNHQSRRTLSVALIIQILNLPLTLLY